ncbi:prolyl oligopeptidase family serine peptidase [Litorimonas sp. RW-G-Af-16]|uniref:prolyl oligopeptidase family serine peptidase n=1 Tax=Litorimonas sp. RW-G-Af-16 TaxID=3241168 RepID=UPI003AACA584
MITAPKNTPAPKAQRIDKKHERFGHTWIDPYAWMKDDNWQAVMQDASKLNADIRAHLEAENAYTEAALAPLSKLKDAIFEEMKGRLEPNAQSLPLPDGDYAYFHYFREGDEHGVYARHPIGNPDKKHIMLDADALAKDGKGYFDLGDVSHSPDHKWLAYSVDRQGAENFRVFVKSLETGEVFATGIDRSAGGLVWASDNHTLFWVERDDNQRPYAVRFKDIFDNLGKVYTAYEEADPGFFVSVGTSDDLASIEISAHNHTTSEVWRVPAFDPTTPAQCFAPRLAGQEYSVHDQGSKSYILTNADGATDFAIMVASQTDTSRETWMPFISHTPGTLILGVEAFEHFLVRLERINALPRIIIRDMRSGEEHAIEMDEPAYELGLISGYEYRTSEIFFSYSSPTTPEQAYCYNMETRERELVKEQVVPSGHDRSNYAVERMEISARDGARVPVTLLRRKDVTANGQASLLLYGYGSYGITISASFRTRILSLVDRGFVYAIAHIRGGMSKGYQWYLDGKLEKKTNTFNDYIDVGHALVKAGWTRSGRIIAHGGSARWVARRCGD